VARGLSLVAGGGFTAPSGPAVERPILRDLGGGWSLPQPVRPTLAELFAGHPRDAGWAGFLLAQLESGKPLLWVQDRMAILEAGRIYPPGLGLRDLIHVTARDARSALWAMEEGLRCAALGAVIGELWGDPASLDFTATRRLAVAAERSGVPAWLVRLGGAANLSGARMRWRVASAPSLANPFDPRASGAPAWDAELFRARGMPPGQWAISHDSHSFHLVAAPGDRALEQDSGPRRAA
jgi:protein ImuA